MSTWWYVIVIAVIAIAGLKYLAARKAKADGNGDVRGAGTLVEQNHHQTREGDRRARMSDDDRSWEAASLQRDQATRERFGQAGGESGTEAERSYPAVAATSGPDRPAPVAGGVPGPSASGGGG